MAKIYLNNKFVGIIEITDTKEVRRIENAGFRIKMIEKA